jgi:hypothetical protein
MAKYQKHFSFDPRDIEIIESAVRREISNYARVGAEHPDYHEARAKLREMSELLGRIFNQKVFFSQVNRMDVPSA